MRQTTPAYYFNRNQAIDPVELQKHLVNLHNIMMLDHEDYESQLPDSLVNHIVLPSVSIKVSKLTGQMLRLIEKLSIPKSRYDADIDNLFTILARLTAKDEAASVALDYIKGVVERQPAALFLHVLRSIRDSLAAEAGETLQNDLYNKPGKPRPLNVTASAMANIIPQSKHQAIHAFLIAVDKDRKDFDDAYVHAKLADMIKLAKGDPSLKGQTGIYAEVCRAVFKHRHAWYPGRPQYPTSAQDLIRLSDQFIPKAAPRASLPTNALPQVSAAQNASLPAMRTTDSARSSSLENRTAVQQGVSITTSAATSLDGCLYVNASQKTNKTFDCIPPTPMADFIGNVSPTPLYSKSVSASSAQATRIAEQAATTPSRHSPLVRTISYDGRSKWGSSFMSDSYLSENESPANRPGSPIDFSRPPSPLFPMDFDR